MRKTARYLYIILLSITLSAQALKGESLAAPPPPPPQPSKGHSTGAPAGAPLDAVQMNRALEESERAEGRRLSDFTLTDQDGRSFHLSDYFKGSRKPLIVSFIYTSCPEVCPTITAALKKTVAEAREKYGDSFNVLSVSFDPANDTPERLKAYSRRFSLDNSFVFASPAIKDSSAIMKEFGFFYRKKGESFEHLDMASIVKPDGTIYKQVYSIRTQENLLIERLGELLTGKSAPVRPASLIDKLKYFCYRYDAGSGRYVVDYPMVAGLFLQLSVIALIIGVVWGRRIKGFLGRLFHRAS